MRATTLLGGLTTTLLLTASAGLAQPSFEVMGHFGGVIVGNPAVTDISADGRFVIGGAPPQGGGFASYRYERGVGRFDYVRPQFPFLIIDAQGISGNGQHVVGVANAASGSPSRVFRSTNNGAFDVFAEIPGTNGLFNAKVNGDGSRVVVNARTSGGAQLLQRPVVFSSATSFSNLPLPSTAANVFSSARDVTDDGRVVVGSAEDTARGNADYAFAWREDIGSAFLSVPANTVGSGASTISRDGTWIGGAIRRNNLTDFIRWSGDTFITAPVPLRAGGTWDFVTPTHITSDGRIATGELGYIGDSGGFIRQGFVWTEQFGVQLLRDYLISAQVPKYHCLSPRRMSQGPANSSCQKMVQRSPESCRTSQPVEDSRSPSISFSRFPRPQPPA